MWTKQAACCWLNGAFGYPPLALEPAVGLDIPLGKVMAVKGQQPGV